MEQECIPVGCVPAAHRPYAGVWSGGGVSGPGGVCSRGGVSGPGGCLLPGGCLVWGVSAPGGVCLGGVYALGGVCLGVSTPVGGGVCSRGGGGIPACTEADPPCEQNDRQV